MTYGKRYSRYFSTRYTYRFWGHSWHEWRSFDRPLPNKITLINTDLGYGATPFSYYPGEFEVRVKRLDRYYRARMAWREWGAGQARCAAKRVFDAEVRRNV